MVPQILDAAERLLARRSSLDVSIRDIAAEAGVPHSAIYRYFENKDDLFRRVLIRGRDRQRENDALRRASGRPFDGAMEWIMTENRCYAMAIARAAMEGQTGSALGLNSGESTAMQSVRALEGGNVAPGAPASLDPRVAVAATTALVLGWAVAEDWIVDALSLGDMDRDALRAKIDEVFGLVVTASRGATGRPVEEA